MSSQESLEISPSSEAPKVVRRPIKTSVLVARALAERIAHLEPGMMLSSEREMIAELGVGRGTLREALRLLELQGLIRVKPGPGGGPVVQQLDHRPLADNLALFLQNSNVTFGEILHARELIEAELASLAARNATQDEIAAIKTSISAMEEHIDDETYFLEENRRFHQLCAGAARSEVLRVFHSSLDYIHDGHSLGVDYGSKQIRSSVLRAHRRIAESIFNGDEAGARSAMADHLHEFDNFVSRHYPKVLERPIRVLPNAGA